MGLLAMLGATCAYATPAQALPLPQASNCAGIWVVVDFAALGGGTQMGCAATYTTGTSALRNAFPLWPSPGLDNGMIVKINGLPTTPDTSKNYWSYWHATRKADGSYSAWSYSSLGSNAFQPGPDDAEGWRYESVSGGYIPPSAAPPRQTTVTQAPATTAPAAPATTTRTTTAPKTTTAGAAATTTTATTTAAMPTGSADPAATSSDSASPSTSDTPTPSPTAADTPSSSPEPPPASSPPAAQNRAATMSLLGGLGAIGAIAAGAAGVLWWRKRSVIAG
ncbi:MAG: hypothetical protein HY829_09455 [Actinobacteria bacterium]|nr:hypothetical protein [Actinomycetota bacterium]